MSEFRLQIVYEDGTAARFQPGTKSEEGDLIRACADRIVGKGVGLFTTEAQVRAAIETGMREVFYDLKANIRA